MPPNKECFQKHVRENDKSSHQNRTQSTKRVSCIVSKGFVGLLIKSTVFAITVRKRTHREQVLWCTKYEGVALQQWSPPYSADCPL